MEGKTVEKSPKKNSKAEKGGLKHLGELSTINWLRKRFNNQTKIQYLNAPAELRKHIEIERVFKAFDEDGSNSLDVHELYEMFCDNNIHITKQELQDLFSIVDEDGSGELSLDEFKIFSFSEEANRKFRTIINKIREDEMMKPKHERAPFLPFNFGTLLNYLSQKTKRQKLRNKIFGSDQLDVEKA